MQWIADSVQSLFGTTSASSAHLQNSGVLSKEQLLKFFAAGHQMFDDPTVKIRLKEAASRKQNVDWVITEMQKQIFESQGIHGTFGIGFLGKVRSLYGDDVEMMQHLMQFVEREEMALDEAELTLDEFLKKLELKDWATKQYHEVKEQLKNMTPQQQRDYLLQQQLMMKEVNKESVEAIKASENMTVEEKNKYIAEQVAKIQARFQFKPKADDHASHGPNCQHCNILPTTSLTRNSELGSSMTPEEQANFFRSMYDKKR